MLIFKPKSLTGLIEGHLVQQIKALPNDKVSKGLDKRMVNQYFNLTTQQNQVMASYHLVIMNNLLRLKV